MRYAASTGRNESHDFGVTVVTVVWPTIDATNRMTIGVLDNLLEFGVGLYYVTGMLSVFNVVLCHNLPDNIDIMAAEVIWWQQVGYSLRMRRLPILCERHSLMRG